MEYVRNTRRCDDMEIGIGLPSTVPGTTGKQIVDWAQRADQAGFSSLGTIDRIVYPNYDPLIALAAAAAVTERIRVATTVLLGPLRANAALLAKQALSIDALAGGGRTVLGIGIGDRDDDYAVSHTSKADRGRWMDSALGEIRAIWDQKSDATIGPAPENGGPRLIIAGGSDASFERAARFSDGWIMGGGTPEGFATSVEKLQAAWERAGRSDKPHTAILAYFSLGADGDANAEGYLRDYYGWLGIDVAAMIAGSAAKDAETVRAYAAAFEAIGCDELIFMPASSDPHQVDLLAEAVQP